MKEIAVGSENPVKVEAVKETSQQVFDQVELKSIDAPSGVSEMPHGHQEAMNGAENRAQFCLNQGDFDLAFGLEGFVLELEGKMFLSGWSVAIDPEGKKGYGNKGMILLPEKIADKIRHGEELGPVMDDVLNEEETKKGPGTVGVLTSNKVSRKESFKRAVMFSLSNFLTEDFYQKR